MAETTGVNLKAQHLTDLDTDAALTANSDAKIPSQKAVKAYVDTAFAGAEPLAALDTDTALAADSDSKVASQHAVKTYADGKIASAALDTDTSLAADSDSKVASQKATKAYVDTKVAAALPPRIVLSSAVLKALASTPFELIAAPEGANVFLDTEKVTVLYVPGNTPYTIPGADPKINIGMVVDGTPTAFGQIDPTGLLDQTVPALLIVGIPIPASQPYAAAGIENEALIAWLDVVAGGGPIDAMEVANGYGGAYYAVGDTGTISGGNNDAAYAVAAVDSPLSIVGVNTGPGGIGTGFVLSGDHSSLGGCIVTGSTGNNGSYTIASIAFDGGLNQTTIDVNEAVSNSTIDGSVHGGAVTALTLTAPGTQYIVHSPDFAVAGGGQPGLGQGLGINVTAINSTGPEELTAGDGTLLIYPKYNVVDPA